MGRGCQVSAFSEEGHPAQALDGDTGFGNAATLRGREESARKCDWLKPVGQLTVTLDGIQRLYGTVCNDRNLQLIAEPALRPAGDIAGNNAEPPIWVGLVGSEKLR